MRVWVDGVVRLDTFVQTSQWKPYPVPVTATGADVEIRVEFDNDFYGGSGNDRNLHVDKVTVDCQALIYSFESGVMGWTNVGAPGTSSASSTAQAFDGTKSLALNVDGAGQPTVSVAPLQSPAAGKTVSLRVYVPTAAPVIAVAPYVLDGTWAWSDGYSSAITKGSWQSYTVTVPPGAALPLNRIGVMFHMSGSYNGPVYVDAVGW
jgi:hypothetical protein